MEKMERYTNYVYSSVHYKSVRLSTITSIYTTPIRVVLNLTTCI